MIMAVIYDQEGNLMPFKMSDTPENRLFATWLKLHDRYTINKERSNETTY